MSRDFLVEIFCEANEQVGYGHIRRSSTLAAALERGGTDVRLSGLSENARRLLPPPQHAGRCAQVAVFDCLEGIDSQIDAARAQGQIVVTLDWFGATVPDVNIAVYAHGEVRARRTAHTGFEYILVRDEIATLPKPQCSGHAGKVLVMLGGGDALGQGHEVAARLCNGGYDVTLVQGPLARSITAGAGYRVYVNPPELPQLLAVCDWAVTNGGGCLFEALCLGKAAYVVPQSEAEMKIAHYAMERSAVLGVGLDGLRGFDADELAPVAQRGARLVDGRGGQRIAAIVRGLQ